MSEVEKFVYTISPMTVKEEPESDSEFEVSCRLCNKVFASSTALQNHARIAHIDAYVTGNPEEWTEKNSPEPSPKKRKLDPDTKTKIDRIVASMKPTNMTTLASQNVKYIIIKTEDAEEFKKAMRIKKKKEGKVKKVDPKGIEAITGPFECLEPSTLGADGSCHQMFFSCCEYSNHQLSEHTRPRRRTARCQVCERPLSQLHQPDKKFTCEQCIEGFDTESELTEHKNQFHMQKKRFQCSVCQKRFSAQGGVVQHMRLHTGDRPYACCFCPKAFTQKSGLEQHTRTHTKVKPFTCVICRKSFIQTVHLKQHMRTHTNVAPFQCVVCDKRFKQSSHLNYHLKNHPANMTEEQKTKYRHIVDRIQRDETQRAERSIQEPSEPVESEQTEMEELEELTEQEIAENSIQYHETDETEHLTFVECDDSRIITCELAYD